MLYLSNVCFNLAFSVTNFSNQSLVSVWLRLTVGLSVLYIFSKGPTSYLIEPLCSFISLVTLLNFTVCFFNQFLETGLFFSKTLRCIIQLFVISLFFFKMWVFTAIYYFLEMPLQCLKGFRKSCLQFLFDSMIFMLSTPISSITHRKVCCVFSIVLFADDLQFYFTRV